MSINPLARLSANWNKRPRICADLCLIRKNPGTFVLILRKVACWIFGCVDIFFNLGGNGKLILIPNAGDDGNGKS